MRGQVYKASFLLFGDDMVVVMRHTRKIWSCGASATSLPFEVKGNRISWSQFVFGLFGACLGVSCRHFREGLITVDIISGFTAVIIYLSTASHILYYVHLSIILLQLDHEAQVYWRIQSSRNRTHAKRLLCTSSLAIMSIRLGRERWIYISVVREHHGSMRYLLSFHRGPWEWE